MQNIQKYQKKIFDLLEKITTNQKDKFFKVAQEFYKTYKKNGMIYIFGTGHSHMLAEEGHFRAGGFAPICPILNSSLMLHEDTLFSSVLERTDGVASNLIKKYNIESKDILVIFTNSGVNQAPLEASYIAKKLKCKTVGVSSESYSKIAKKSKYKKRLSEVVDYHFDNYGPPGDALIEIKKNFNVSPFSTIAGSFILNSIISEVAELAKNEKPFPFYISGNMPNAEKHNKKLMKKYIKKNPHI
ncbi:sugar isomerase domain-containing protein [Alphaproteobacteria bacterium]|nr:sugar isomerase domain-containing protein [Alphaproteobacteria bacterium]